MPSPPALDPAGVPERTGTLYPADLGERCKTRGKRAIGNELGLTHFGVNVVRMEPGSWSSLRHWHSHEDEFVYVLEGELTLVTDEGEQRLGPGMAAGFPAGVANGHHLVNRGSVTARYLEVGSRALDDQVDYADVDLHFSRTTMFTHKDGRPY